MNASLELSRQPLPFYAPLGFLILIFLTAISENDSSAADSASLPSPTQPELRASISTNNSLKLEYHLISSGTFSIYCTHQLGETLGPAQILYAGPVPQTRLGQWVVPARKDSGASFFFLQENTNQLPARMIWIPPGNFLMGSATNELGRETDEGPQHPVTIQNGFWMSKFEATQSEFTQIMGDNPSRFGTNGVEFPVESVTWKQATNYCGRLTNRERLAGRLPDGFVYRLPTEAEWEYACRAGTRTRRYFGDDPMNIELEQFGWYGSVAQSTTHQVGLLHPNAWGLYDMNGNVFEWCWDVYAPYPGGSATANPDAAHVYRGGSWYCPPNVLRSADRHGIAPKSAAFIGFRIVLARPIPNGP